MDDEVRTTILDLLESHDTLALATVRGDGFPQSTVMNYVHDGLSVYFWCDSKTQKAHNLKRNPKVSAALNSDSSDWMKARGLSLGGYARRVTSRDELDLAMTLSLAKYPQMVKLVPEDFQEPLCFRIDAVAFTILDYTQGMGHTRQVMTHDPDATGRRGLRPRILRSA